MYTSLEDDAVQFRYKGQLPQPLHCAPSGRGLFGEQERGSLLDAFSFRLWLKKTYSKLQQIPSGLSISESYSFSCQVPTI